MYYQLLQILNRERKSESSIIINSFYNRLFSDLRNTTIFYLLTSDKKDIINKIFTNKINVYFVLNSII